MHLGKIELNGFKGLFESLDIAPLNLLVGPNGSGKSAILQAIAWAITSRTDFGDKLDAVRQLAGPTGCVVRVETSGPRWSRSLAVGHAEDRLSSALSIDGTHGLGARGAAEELARLVGNFAPMFDLRAFLDLSDDKRRGFVMGLCAAATGHRGGGDICDRITKAFLVIALGSGTIEAATRADDKGLDALVKQLGQRESQCFYAAMHQIADHFADKASGIDVCSILSSALDAAKELAGKHRHLHDDGVAAARKLADRKAEIVVVAQSVEELTEQLAEAVKDRDELSRQIANQDGRQSARDSLMLQLTTLKARETKLEEAAEENATKDQALYTVYIDKLNAQADELDKRHEEVPTDEAIEESIAAAKLAEDNSRISAETAVAEGKALAELAERREQLTRQLERAKADPWGKLVKMLNAWWIVHGPIDTNEPSAIYAEIECFAAEQVADDVDAIGRLIVENAELTHPDRLAAMETEAETCRKVAVAAMQASNDLIERRRRIADDNHRLDREAATLRERAMDMKIEHGRLQKDFDSTTKQLEEARTQIVETERSLNDLDAKGGHVPVADLTEQRDATTNAIAVVEEHIKNRRAYQVLEAELTKCAAAAEADQAMHDVCKTLQKAIKAVREPLMHDLVAPLIDRMNKFLATAAPGRTAYCRLEGEIRTQADTDVARAIQKGRARGLGPARARETGKAPFELGWTVDGERKTTYPAMSGGEQAIYGCALAYALVVLADPPLKLLLIEAGEIDVLNLSLLMDALENVSADLSNILVATHHSVLGATAQTWNVIDRRTPEMAGKITARGKAIAEGHAESHKEWLDDNDRRRDAIIAGKGSP